VRGFGMIGSEAAALTLGKGKKDAKSFFFFVTRTHHIRHLLTLDEESVIIVIQRLMRGKKAFKF